MSIQSRINPITGEPIDVPPKLHPMHAVLTSDYVYPGFRPFYDWEAAALGLESARHIGNSRESWHARAVQSLASQLPGQAVREAQGTIAQGTTAAVIEELRLNHLSVQALMLAIEATARDVCQGLGIETPDWADDEPLIIEAVNQYPDGALIATDAPHPMMEGVMANLEPFPEGVFDQMGPAPAIPPSKSRKSR